MPDATRRDGCPECMHRNNPPIHTERVSPRGVQCTYACANCGSKWNTSWWDYNDGKEA